MSWKAEVIADHTGKFCGNAVRFEHEFEAKAYAQDLAYRWTAVREWRVAESEDPVAHRWLDGRTVGMEA